MNMPLKRFAISAAIAIAGLTFAAAHAEEPVSARAITDALKPKPLTRSLGAPAGLSQEDSRFVDGLRGKSRAITVVERKKLAVIVKEKHLPEIDLEVYFDFDSARITGEATPQLVQLGLALRGDSLKGSTFLLSGHTDAVGRDEYNQRLSEERAWSVRDFLVKSFSIDPDRLIAVGFGEEQLKNADYPDAAENRRVQIVNVSR
jgi:outer membrane protein OmpA-like peptidoglycan-associated protein